MDVKKPTYFVIATFILVVALMAVIFKYSQHPLGADFTTFKSVTSEEIKNSSSLIEKRICLRGIAKAESEESIINQLDDMKDLKDKRILGYIKVKILPGQGKFGQFIYEKFDTKRFNICVGDAVLPVSGQPEQLDSPKDMIKSDGNPNTYWMTLREGIEYSIFGTVKSENGKAVLVPYLITTAGIEDVVRKTVETNKKVNLTQFVIIFVIVLGYIVFLWQGGVLGKSADEENTNSRQEQSNETEQKTEK
jgi:hypothetical protein